MQTGPICASHRENVVVHPAVRVCSGDVIKMSTYRGRTRRAVCSVSSLYIPVYTVYAWAFTVCFLKSTESPRRRAPTRAPETSRQRVEKKTDYVEISPSPFSSSSPSSDLLSLVSTRHGARMIHANVSTREISCKTARDTPTAIYEQGSRKKSRDTFS